ncbi:GCN5-related N-acetyltransferase [Opitutus terrae PB90-1]|uniref:GCN5-related N-acetyltransferase n=1 Tax=Opitutus terrae (strain DSM 11246 / JCM 15787 / PB90-1) TaxID=452637 RepID=B1ZTS3_OPITP|nr:GCN5-related N-acetyltransferase [Opitutus terrae PB90-1]
MLRVLPVILTGARVRLEPLVPAHLDELTRAGSEPEIWRYFPCAPAVSREQMRAWIEARRGQEQLGTALPFAIIDLVHGRAVGSTSYMDISARDDRLEIGSTWLGREARRTAINTECKFLLLRHAFEVLGANRVQLKTDARNLRSQAAIERLGAIKEGVLRAHMVMADGFVRDTVMYSVIAAEWPAVKQRLEQLLRRTRGREQRAGAGAP